MRNIYDKFSEFTAIILNNTFDAIGILSPVNNAEDFRFEYVNDSVERVSKKPKDYFTGKTVRELFPYTLTSGLIEDFRKTYETGNPTEKIYYHEDSFYKGWYKCSVVKYDDGLVAYFRDVTKEKKTELGLKLITDELRLSLKEKEMLLMEKELLLKEIHHRIKNNLQVIASMLQLQENKIHDPVYQDMFRESRQRISNIASIHERLYESSTHTSVNMYNFVKELSKSLMKLYSSSERYIKMNYQIENIEAGTDYTISIGIIINELLTNCLKYAFKGIKEPEITVELYVCKDKICLTVADNGIGLPEDLDPESSDSLGLLIVYSIVDRMNGTIDIKRTSPGTAFRIFLPVINNTHSVSSN